VSCKAKQLIVGLLSIRIELGDLLSLLLVLETMVIKELGKEIHRSVSINF